MAEFSINYDLTSVLKCQMCLKIKLFFVSPLGQTSASIKKSPVTLWVSVTVFFTFLYTSAHVFVYLYLSVLIRNTYCAVMVMCEGKKAMKIPLDTAYSCYYLARGKATTS